MRSRLSVTLPCLALSIMPTGCGLPLVAPPLRSTASIGGGVGQNPLAAEHPGRARGSVQLTAVPQTLFQEESRRRFDVGVGYGWLFSGAPPRHGPVVEFSYYPILWPDEPTRKRAREKAEAARKSATAAPSAADGKPTKEPEPFEDPWTARLAMRVAPQVIFGLPGDPNYGAALNASFGVEIQSRVSGDCGAGASSGKDGFVAGGGCYYGAFGAGVGLQSSLVLIGDTHYATLGIGITFVTPGIVGGGVVVPNPASLVAAMR